MRVGLLSSDKFIGICKDNILLEKRYKEHGIDVSEVTWETEDTVKAYDRIIVRSTWGYQRNYKQYLKKLAQLSGSSVLLNSYNTIKNNIYKENQFEELSRKQIPCISTKIFDRNQFDVGINYVKRELAKGKRVVLKPNISASGQDTILIDKHASSEKILSYFVSQFSVNKKVMIQDYISDVKNGEISMIYISGTFSHSVLRYPGIFSDKKETIEIETSDKFVQWCNGVVEKLNLSDELYARIDIVITKEGPLIMEIELNEPDLFFRKIHDPEMVMDNFVVKSIGM